MSIDIEKRIELFTNHLQQLSLLEDEYKAVLQGKSLVKYYFKSQITPSFLNDYYLLNSVPHQTQLHRLLTCAALI